MSPQHASKSQARNFAIEAEIDFKVEAEIEIQIDAEIDFGSKWSLTSRSKCLRLRCRKTALLEATTALVRGAWCVVCGGAC